MVIRIKPLRHLACLCVLRSSCNGIIGLNRNGPAIVFESFWHNTEHCGRVQHVIIQRKVIYGDKRDTFILLQLHIFQPNLLKCLQKCGLLQIALPERLQRFFPFTIFPNTRVSQYTALQLSHE
ncbi:hypothetical protein D3C78_938570 [compost metagenome]